MIPTPANAAKVRAAQARVAQQNAAQTTTRKVLGTGTIPSPFVGVGGAMHPGPAPDPNLIHAPIIQQVHHIHPTTPAPASITPSAVTTRQIQQQLVKQGFHIAVDGIMGPQTSKAMTLSKQPGGAARFNGATGSTLDPNTTAPARDRHNHNTVTKGGDQNPTRIIGKVPDSIGAWVNGGGTGKNDPTKPLKVVSSKTGRTVMPDGPSSIPNWQNIALPNYDPQKEATDIVAAKYLPQEQALNQEQQNDTNAGANRQADIASSYGSTIADIAANNTASEGAVAQDAAAIQGMPAAIAAGVPMSPEMAAVLARSGSIDAAAAIASSAAQKQQDAANQDNMRLGQQYEQNLASQNTAAQLADVNHRRSDLSGQKGADTAAAVAQAKQDYRTNLLQIQQANRDGRLSTAQAKESALEAKRNYGLAVTQTKITAAASNLDWAKLGEGQREFDISTQTDRAKIAATKAYTQAQTRLKQSATSNARADVATTNASQAITGPRGFPKFSSLEKAYGQAARILEAGGLKEGSPEFISRMKIIMQGAHINTGPKGRPTGLSTPRPKK